MENLQSQNIRFDAQGRALIPKSMRDALHIANGDEAIGWLEDGRLVLEPRKVLLERLQSRYADIEASLADELIEERREEAQRDSP
jgi:bifunctional DNA-binding transcriptional regulator/antitoxin component of YhaV-PrlF toxin-antitoxin module